MSQEVEDAKTQATKPSPVPAIVLSIVFLVLLAFGAYMTFGRGATSPAGVAGPDKPPVEQPKGPVPTIRAGSFVDVPPGLVNTPAAARFELAGLQFLTIYFDERWSAMDQNHSIIPNSGYPILKPDLWELQGQWNVFNGRFDFVQALKRTGPGAFSYDARFTSEEGVQSQLVCTEIFLPVASYVGEQIVVDGTELKLPETLRHPWGKVADTPSFKKLEIATSVGRLVIEGAGGLSVVDHREYGHDWYTVRLHFTPEKGLLKETELHLKMKVIP